MHQSSSTTKRQEDTSTNKSTLFKIITTKLLLKVKTKTEKLLPIKHSLTVKEKPSSSIYLQQNKPLTNSEIDRVKKEDQKHLSSTHTTRRILKYKRG
jgi:hypothetical protein